MCKVIETQRISSGLTLMSENLTDRYKNNNYAIYVPSLQSGYAQYAVKQNKDVRNGALPRGFRMRDLDFLDPRSKLWSCGYTLYSSGQFDKSQIRQPDMVRDRKRDDNSKVIGDSGGYQLGTGVIKNAEEHRALQELATNRKKLYAQWQDIGFRRRTLRWLDVYTDYAMTLDMVLWGIGTKNSVLRGLTVPQAIDLTVDNNRYFSENRRGVSSGGTRFLNVLQDTGKDDDSGELWYQAVKDFDFEGWSFGGETTRLDNFLRWCHRLLRENKLEKAEWLHILGKSPPVFSVVYTAIQQALCKAAGHQITISYDSSSPHQYSGKYREMCESPVFTTDLKKTWVMGHDKIDQNIQLALGDITKPLPHNSPVSKYFTLNHLNFHKDLYRDNFVDSLSEHIMTNHNIYVYHRAALDACDLVFENSSFHPQVPTYFYEFKALMSDFFQKSDCEAMLRDRENAKLLSILGG
jgi:hypothetical protein